MDIQGQQHPMYQLSQEELQQLVALVLRVVVRLDDHTLSQLLENRQFTDELAQEVAQEVAEEMAEEKGQAARLFIAPKPEWTVEEKKIEELIDEEQMGNMIYDGLSFGNSYTRIMRNGAQVLYMLSEFYDENVLEVVKEEDLQPLPNKGGSWSTGVHLGDQYAAWVHGLHSVTSKTLKTIKGNFERLKGMDQITPTLTASSQPRIEVHTYRKGERRARQ